MQNIGSGSLKASAGTSRGVQREAKRGLITTVGYKLRDRPACYALEGSIKIAGAALTWLRDNMQLIENYEECDQLVNRTTNSAGVFFVPALGGLYSPYWDPNAAGLYIGLSQFSRREHIVRATYDSIAFQTNDILSLMHGVANGLMIDGGLCKSDNMCQILADITGCNIVRPDMCETSALGAAMVAGYGAGIWDYDSMLSSSQLETGHKYSPSPPPSTALGPHSLIDTQARLLSPHTDDGYDSFDSDDNEVDAEIARLNQDPRPAEQDEGELGDNRNYHRANTTRRRRSLTTEKHVDVFQPYISLKHRNELVQTWRLAVVRSMQWTKVQHEEIRRIDYQRLSSLPISMYVFFSIGMVALSGFMSLRGSVMTG